MSGCKLSSKSEEIPKQRGKIILVLGGENTGLSQKDISEQ